MYGGKIRAWFGGANGNKGVSVGAKSRFRKSLTEESRVLSDSSNGYGSVLVAAVLAALVVVWAATNLLSGGEGFAVPVSDKVMGGEEAASALARLFAALVLGLFLADSVGWCARWVAVGLVVLGLGHLVFGYLEPLIQEDPPSSTSRSTRPSSPRRWPARYSWWVCSREDRPGSWFGARR